MSLTTPVWTGIMKNCAAYCTDTFSRVMATR